MGALVYFAALLSNWVVLFQISINSETGLGFTAISTKFE